MIPLIDLTRRQHTLAAEVAAASARVLESGRLLLGPELEALEAELAAWSGYAHAIGVGSGTDALTLALRAAGIGAGDEVLVPAFTAVPTVAAVCAAGATPVPVDVDARSAAIDPGAARAACTARTRAVIPVHLYGRPCDVAPLAELGLLVIEDAAQAHGALEHGHSVAVAYSFYPTKNLGGIGDGGAVVTDDAALADEIRLLRHHGMRELYVHERIATNSRMSELEAAVLRIGLRHLPAWNERRRAIAWRYREAAPRLAWHADHPRHVHHLCVLRSTERAALRARLPAMTAIHYPLAVTQQPAYRAFTRDACPRAEAWAAECLSLPCFPELRDDEVERLCEALEA
jgi:dTDP-3-amino-3,4,6-trideoxy-alpha-D-glucose transaminase